jgi:hypothetical protein
MPRGPFRLISSHKVDDQSRNNDTNREDNVSNNVNVGSFKVQIFNFILTMMMVFNFII